MRVKYKLTHTISLVITKRFKERERERDACPDARYVHRSIEHVRCNLRIRFSIPWVGRLLLQVASEGRHARFAVVVVVVAILSSSTVRIARSSRETQGARSQPELERTTDRQIFLEDSRRWIRSREDVSRLSFPPAVAHRTRSDATAIAPDVGDAVSFLSPISSPLLLPLFIIFVYARGWRFAETTRRVTLSGIKYSTSNSFGELRFFGTARKWSLRLEER